MNLTSIVSKFMIIVITGLFLSCKERLPSYEDPTHVFSGMVRPSYLYSETQNHVDVQLVVVNDYDETFEGATEFEGSIEIALSRKPDVKKTLLLSFSNLRQGKYNAGSRILTFDPGSQVRLGATWDFIDDRGVDLRKEEFVYRADTTCPIRGIAQEELFLITGRLKLYDRTEEIKFGPVTFAMCHINAWIDRQTCSVRITPDDACKVR